MSDEPSTTEGEHATYHQPNWTVGVVNQTVVQGSPAAEELTPANRAAVEARYRARVIERYNWLGFAGLGMDATLLSDVALDDVFVRLTLTVEKIEREPIPAEEEEAERRTPRRRGERSADPPRERIVVTQEPISLSDALTQHLLIVGEPGAGKSTLLRWLAVTFVGGKQREADRLGPQADADRLPLLVELGRLPEVYLKAESRETPNWRRFLPEHLTQTPHFDEIPAPLIAQALDGGRCLLLCDGLDEIADLSARRRMADSLAEYARSSANRLVISSRPAGVSGSEATLGARFRRVTIQRFTPQEVKRFFHFVYNHNPELSPEEQMREANALYHAVCAAPKTLELATTPLLATLLLLIWNEEGYLPERRVDLYERCCRMLIESWEAHHDVAYTGVLREIGWERHLRLLAPLAYAIHSREQRTDADHNELIPILAKAIQDEGLPITGSAEHEAENFLRTLSLRSGLLQFLGGDRYGFPHLTFQEYLTARYIAAQQDPSFSNKNYDPDRPNYIDLVMEHLHEAWWREVHLLVIGHLGSGSEGAEKASKLLLRILHLYRPPWRLLRPLTGNSRQHRFLAAQISWQWERRLAWALAREFLFAATGFDDCAPLGTDADLHRSLTGVARALLLQVVQDPDHREEEDAVPMLVASKTLGKMKKVSPQVVSALLAALTDSDSDVRQAAAQSLGQLGHASPQIISALMSALGNSNLKVQAAAVQSLGQLGQASPEVVSALLAALADAHSDVRRAAAQSLGQMGQASPQVVSALVTALTDSRRDIFGDYPARQAVAQSLGQLGQASPEVVSALLAALADAHSDVRQAAAQSLGQLGQASPDVVSALLAVLADSDSGSDVRQAVAQSLGQLGQASPEVVSALLAALADAHSDVRRAAAQSLGQLGQASPQVVSALVTALADSERDIFGDYPMRRAAAQSLGQLGQTSPEVVSALMTALADADWRVRRAAAQSLGQLGQASPQVMSALLAVLAHSKQDFFGHYPVRQAVAQSLGQLGQASPEVVSALLAMLADADSDVRQVAAQSLGQLGQASPQVVSTLAVQRAAAQGLGIIGQASPQEVSARVRTSAGSGVQQAAAQSLGQLGQATPEVVSALLTALAYADSDVRQAAAQSLAQLWQTSPEVVSSALVAALAYSKSYMQRGAARSLGQLKIADETQLRRVLIALNRRLHDRDDEVRRAALTAIRQLLDGRPIPGYRWVPIRERRQRLRRRRMVGYWVMAITVVLLLAWIAAAITTYLRVDPFIERFVAFALALAALVAGGVQILSYFRRPPWDR